MPVTAPTKNCFGPVVCRLSPAWALELLSEASAWASAWASGLLEAALFWVWVVQDATVQVLQQLNRVMLVLLGLALVCPMVLAALVAQLQGVPLLNLLLLMLAELLLMLLLLLLVVGLFAAPA